MNGERVSRRHLVLLGASTLAVLGGVACKKQPPASCNDTNSLSPADIELRKTLEYVDRSPLEANHCEKCRQYEEPAAVDQCGKCKVMKGPVHPHGTCKVFAPRE
jgi:hypothetical protein